MKLDFLSKVPHFFPHAELWDDSIEIMRVDHKKQIHLLSVPDQPPRDFNGYLPAHAASAEVVGPFRLQLAYLAQVTLGHRLDRRQVIAVAVKAPGLEAIKRIILAKIARQFAVNEDVASASVHAVERRFGPSRLDRDQRSPVGSPATFPNDVRQLFNRGRLK